MWSDAIMSGQVTGGALAIALLLGGIMYSSPSQAEPLPVELVQQSGRWILLRDGQPYSIKGAGGDASIELLAACGGNSVRTWGADDLDARLDAAHAAGISVTIGIWLGHERHGFDYNDADMVAEQYERARAAILRYRNHPALLLWSIGNEMEGYEEGDNAAIWSAVNNIA
jgi:exo-beta-1,3-glucanase (GH17 family)